MDAKLSSQLSARRFLTREPARLEIIGKKTILFCRMNNLSATGAFFEILNSNYTPRPGEVVRVVINLKQVNKTHTLNGQIVWAKGLGIGIQFIKHKRPNSKSVL